jgi:uncharacterized protein YndB with AHSA1/START domain
MAEAGTATKEFVLTRVCNAPRQLVWQCFAKPSA